MKIKTSLILLTLTFVIVIIAVGFVMFLAFGQINREVGHYDDINKMLQDMSELSILTHEYSIYHGERMQQQWLVQYEQVAGRLEKVRKEEVHAEHLAILESIASDHKILGDLFSRLETCFAERKRLIKENKPGIEIDVTFALEERVVAHALMRVQKITSENSKFSAAAREEIARAQERAGLTVLFSIIGFGILSFCISFLLVRTIARPLHKLRKGAEIIGRGDLKHRVDVGTKNEIGELDVAFNQMTENLREVTASRDELNSEIVARKEAEEELKSANQQLRASEQQLRASNEQLKASEQQLHAEITERKKMEGESQERLYELEVFYNASTGREERIVELKEKVRKLEDKIKLKQEKEVHLK